MLRLTARIEIQSQKRWVFDKLVACEITRDSETLTDTCTITLPRKVTWKGESANPLKRGDAITIWLGYDDKLQLAFKGYITTIGLKAPVTIKCEDEMFRLKRVAAKQIAYKAATIEQILKDQDLRGLRFKVHGEQNVGQYRVTAKTVTELLSHLKENGIRSFIKLVDGQPVLYSGVLFPSQTGHEQVFATGVNIVSDSSLETQNAADVLLKVKAVSIRPDNKKIKVEVGDADGEKRTLHTYNKTEKELKAWAEQELARLKRDGLTGSFTTFGHVLIDKLDNVGIKIDGERKGIYQVTKNVIKYDTGGFRQELTIGNRVAE